MERKNKASLFSKIRFLEQKGRFSEKQSLGLPFFRGIYLCEQDEKGLKNTVQISY
jgi:hypothetical protein